MNASAGSSLYEVLVVPVRVRIGSPYPDLLDWFAADEVPASVLFDFVDSPHPRLIFEIEKPNSMPGAVYAAGKCDCCFRLGTFVTPIAL